MELTRLAERFSEGMGGAAALAFIAFSVVFLVLIGLTFIIFAVRYMAAVVERGKGGSGPTPSKPQKAAPKPAPEKPATTGGASPDGTLIAAIAAAVAASGGGVVTSVRKTTPIGRAMGHGGNWKLAGRSELMEGMD
jgi:Na+-transporting methylmalonyl-CoA/oxaloacetate decarboxylase gamma subunit